MSDLENEEREALRTLGFTIHTADPGTLELASIVEGELRVRVFRIGDQLHLMIGLPEKRGILTVPIESQSLHEAVSNRVWRALDARVILGEKPIE